MELWNPPYCGEEILEVRGIVLPQDYVDFMRQHNGGTLECMEDDEKVQLMIFKLEEVLSGERYKTTFGYWLSSEYSITHDYQNIDTQTVTTLNGVHPADAPYLYKLLYDNHVVIGCKQRDGDRYDLIVIDQDGHYRVVHDGAAESMKMHQFGTREYTKFSFYVKYTECLYETPVGLMYPRIGDYEIVPREALENWKAKYKDYREPRMDKAPSWPYYRRHPKEEPWMGKTMGDVIEFFRSGDM